MVDDGSTDSTPAVLAAVRDPRLRVERQPPAGLTAALNRALSLARAPLVARLDADDLAMPDRLERQRSFLDAHPDVGLLGTAAREVDAAGRHVGASRPPVDDAAIRRALIRKNPFVHSSVMMRRQPRGAGGRLRSRVDVAQDYDLWMRLSRLDADGKPARAARRPPSRARPRGRRARLRPAARRGAGEVARPAARRLPVVVRGVPRPASRRARHSRGRSPACSGAGSAPPGRRRDRAVRRRADVGRRRCQRKIAGSGRCPASIRGGTAGGLGGVALFAAVLVLYLVSYSSVPTSDGYAWIAHIGAGDREKMLPAYHALPMYFLFCLRQLLASLGEPVGTCSAHPGVNAGLAATAAVLLYGAIRLLGGGIYLGWLRAASSPARSPPGTSPTASSTISRWWSWSSCSCCSCVRASGARRGARAFRSPSARSTRSPSCSTRRACSSASPPSPCSGPAARGATGSATASGSRWPARPRRWSWPWPSRCRCAGSRRRTSCGAGSSGRCTRTGPQPYTLGGPAVIALKVLKGELTALVAGTQVVADAARDRALLALGDGALAAGGHRRRLRADGRPAVRSRAALAPAAATPLRRRGGMRGVDRRLRRAAALVVLADGARVPHEHAAPADRPALARADRGAPRRRPPVAARRGDGPARARRPVNVWAAIAPWYRYGLFRESRRRGAAHRLPAGRLLRLDRVRPRRRSSAAAGTSPSRTCSRASRRPPGSRRSTRPSRSGSRAGSASSSTTSSPASSRCSA